MRAHANYHILPRQGEVAPSASEGEDRAASADALLVAGNPSKTLNPRLHFARLSRNGPPSV